MLISPSALSLGITGNKISPIIFEQGQKITNHYTLTGANHPVNVSLSGDLLEFISLSEVQNNEFDLKINFPYKQVPTGSYSFSLHAEEVPSGEAAGGVGSLLSVTKIFQVEVYSYNKDIIASFNVPSVNEGSPITFTVGAQSRCYQDIQIVSAEVALYDSNNKLIETVHTGSKFLPQLSSVSLEGKFQNTNLSPGEYRAEAEINYDGLFKSADSKFSIGTMDLEVGDYTSTLEQGFSEFKVKVKNAWGHELRNIYAKLYINDQEFTQTPSISLPAWETGELKNIVKVGLSEGEYDANLKLFFESSSKEVPLKIKVIPPPEQPADFKGMIPYISLTVTVFLVVILAMILLWKQKSKRKLDKSGQVKITPKDHDRGQDDYEEL
jgi:hypothetical protein